MIIPRFWPVVYVWAWFPYKPCLKLCSFLHALSAGMGACLGSHQSWPPSRPWPWCWNSLGQTPVWATPAGDIVSCSFNRVKPLYPARIDELMNVPVSVLHRLEHYSQMSDVQSLAMLCSVFRGHGSPQEHFTLYGHQQPRPASFTPHHSRYVCLKT